MADNIKMTNWLVLFFAPIAGRIFKTCPAICAEDTGMLKKQVRYNQWQGSMRRSTFLRVQYNSYPHALCIVYIFIRNLSGYLVMKWTLIEFITCGRDHCMHTV